MCDYTGNPDVVSITNAGSNLALGSEDTMHLVNVSISTGGNLAIGTLQDLNIEQTQPSTIQYLLELVVTIMLILITFTCMHIMKSRLTDFRLPDVLMMCTWAVTINLRNVTFPHTSEVTLRSRDGTIGFNQFANPIVGGVNLTNVKHGADLLDDLNKFNGGPGHWSSKKIMPNGTPALQVRKF